MSSQNKKTRVDGKGLWRSWKRNFKTKLLALLDLIDNSLDAAIQGPNCDCQDSFQGKVHVYPDTYKTTTTGLCIVNNCVKAIRPLEKVLEVYNSSKVNSGAGDIGENGVGLKQGCAALCDLSFVLVKNGSDSKIELGIIAKELQTKEGCYLPAFTFSNKRESVCDSLKKQMIDLFSQKKHADVAKCIEQYGAASSTGDPNLILGVERLCDKFDSSFFNNRYVFMIILNQIPIGETDDYVRSSLDAQQKITVNQLLKDLGNEIPRTYLHVPTEFEFMIGGKRTEFNYWSERLVELSSFTVCVNKKIPWQSKLDTSIDHPASYELRVFIGFDGLKVTESTASKEASLFFYSRQSGRLISHHPDARTLLGLSAGGTEFCQGLTVIIDDIGGNLPLNPTKQEVAFGEEDHGSTHEKNLMSWVGCISQFYYKYHLDKFHGRKTELTTKIAHFGDQLLKKNRQLKTLDSSDLTKFNLSFKSTGKNIRVDKSTAKELVGSDTLYRLSVNKKQTSEASSSASGGNRKKLTDEKSDSDLYKGEDDDYEIAQNFVAGRKRIATEPYIPSDIPRRKKPTKGKKVDYDNDSWKSSDDSDVETGDSKYFKHLCGQLTSKVVDLKSERAKFKLKIATQQSENESLRIEKESLRNEKESLRIENESLRIENESLKQNLRAYHAINNVQRRVSNEPGNNVGRGAEAQNWRRYL
ncbi:hypothetical protein ACHAXA_000069 [Cyclostephanos tholiformis]|uniref:Uncharacterized protein n=1 Tax=Cyclostephanos tholiformis TaxID=382380 RepID=A0ABD3SRL1_9STRA